MTISVRRHAVVRIPVVSGVDQIPFAPRWPLGLLTSGMITVAELWYYAITSKVDAVPNGTFNLGILQAPTFDANIDPPAVAVPVATKDWTTMNASINHSYSTDVARIDSVPLSGDPAQSPSANGAFQWQTPVITAQGLAIRGDIVIQSDDLPLVDFGSTVQFNNIMPAVNTIGPLTSYPLSLTGAQGGAVIGSVWRREGTKSQDFTNLGLTVSSTAPWRRGMRAVALDLVSGLRRNNNVVLAGDLASSSDFLILGLVAWCPARQLNDTVATPTLRPVLLRTFLTLPNSMFQFPNTSTTSVIAAAVDDLSQTEMYAMRDAYFTSQPTLLPPDVAGLALIAWRSNTALLAACTWRLRPAVRCYF